MWLVALRSVIVLKLTVVQDAQALQVQGGWRGMGFVGCDDELQVSRSEAELMRALGQQPHIVRLVDTKPNPKP